MTKASLYAIAILSIPQRVTAASAVSGKATGPYQEEQSSLSMVLSSPMSITDDIFAKSGKGHKSGKSLFGTATSVSSQPLMPKAGKAKVFKSVMGHHADDMIMTDIPQSSMSMHVEDAKAGKTMFGKSTGVGKSTKSDLFSHVDPSHAQVDAKAQKVSITMEGKTGKMAKTVIRKTNPFAI